MVEVAYYIVPDYSGGFHGAWEHTLGFPLDILVTDIETGLYVFS